MSHPSTNYGSIGSDTMSTSMSSSSAPLLSTFPPAHHSDEEDTDDDDEDDDDHSLPKTTIGKTCWNVGLSFIRGVKGMFKGRTGSEPSLSQLFQLPPRALMPVITTSLLLVISLSIRLIATKILADTTPPPHSYGTFLLVSVLDLLLPSLWPLLKSSYLTLSSFLRSCSNPSTLRIKKLPPTRPANFTPPSTLPLTVLTLTSLLDTLSSLLQFSFLPCVPGVLSVFLLEAQTLFSSLLECCNSYSRTHILGLGLLALGIASGLTPSAYNLHYSYYSSEQLSVIFYALSTLLTASSTLLKERALRLLDTPPDPLALVSRYRSFRLAWLLFLLPLSTYLTTLPNLAFNDPVDPASPGPLTGALESLRCALGSGSLGKDCGTVVGALVLATSSSNVACGTALTWAGGAKGAGGMVGVILPRVTMASSAVAFLSLSTYDLALGHRNTTNEHLAHLGCVVFCMVGMEVFEGRGGGRGAEWIKESEDEEEGEEEEDDDEDLV
ncbi:hypothetical protein TrRE_jg5316 [Triparma retinervis]|uniref:Uncharacterized protein n=1 Tax=Triparma retinervis TaxID=2557542 RepID=A0A9W7DVZ9_9STRA|nr:hypothetical protein TrRE_jg5316 [Triparma retinervis]